MNQATISEFQLAVFRSYWTIDLYKFEELTGFTGNFAKQKFKKFQALQDALSAFDVQLLALILGVEE